MKIVESFNDAAYPFNGAEDCDAVLCVSTNTVLRFEKDKYFEAIELYARQKSKLQLTVSQVYAASLIKEKFAVQPLSTEERNDPAKLTQNYSKVIEQITEVT